MSTRTERRHPISLNSTKLALIVLVILVAYLCLWPVPIRPKAWEAPPAPAETGVLAPNDHLRRVARIGAGAIRGAEAIAFDAQGRLYTGVMDGRILRVDHDQCTTFGQTEGRPLGLAVLQDGSVVIADARAGLLRMDLNGQVETLADTADGIAINFADDLAVDSEGRIYFTDASWKFGIDQTVFDVMEHAANGRMLRYDPVSGDTYTLLGELYFANGIVLGPNEDYVLINETSAYRITRFWLRGPKAGQREIFADNLPGFPDNITFNGSDRFWVALVSRRVPMIDRLAPYPFLRQMVARLPDFMRPAPGGGTTVLGLDMDGQIVESYQDTGKNAFGPVTSAIEHDGSLYLGSLDSAGIGRISLASLREGEAWVAEAVEFNCEAN